MDIEKRIGLLHDPITWYKIPRAGEHASCTVDLLHGGTSKTKAGEGGLVRVALFSLLVSVVNLSSLVVFSCI